MAAINHGDPISPEIVNMGTWREWHVGDRATKRAMAKRRKAKSTRRKRTSRRWSGRVTAQSDALDLRHGVFTLRDPKKIAASLKRSAELSRRRKSDPYRSAMSMLTFYINRG